MSDSGETALNYIFKGMTELAEWLGIKLKIHPIIIRWIIIFIFVILLFLLIIYVESNLRLAYFASLERRATVLKELNQLANAGVTSKAELAPIYKELVSELLEGKVAVMNFPNLPIFFSSVVAGLFSSMTLYKFLAGAALGIGLIIWALFSRREITEKKKAIKGALFVALIGGFIASLVPLLFNSVAVTMFIILVVFFLIQMLILSFIGRRSHISTQAKSTV